MNIEFFCINAVCLCRLFQFRRACVSQRHCVCWYQWFDIFSKFCTSHGRCWVSLHIELSLLLSITFVSFSVWLCPVSSLSSITSSWPITIGSISLPIINTCLTSAVHEDRELATWWNSTTLRSLCTLISNPLSIEPLCAVIHNLKSYFEISHFRNPNLGFQDTELANSRWGWPRITWRWPGSTRVVDLYTYTL